MRGAAVFSLASALCLCGLSATAADAQPSDAPPSGAPAPPTFTVTSLGSLNDPTRGVHAINNAGTVAGWTRVDLPDGARRAFVQPRDGPIQLLPHRRVAGDTFATGLNGRGWVIGHSQHLGPVVWTPGGEMIAPHTPPPNNLGSAVGINNLNQVAIREYPSGAAFVWEQRTGLRQITSGGISVEAIGDGGHVAGHIQSGGGGGNRAMLWSGPTGLVEIGTHGESTATGVNRKGHAVGYAMSRDSHSPFFWSEETGLLDLGQLPDHPVGTIARAINNDDWVVGDTINWPDRLRRAFLWSPTFGMHDLNNLLDPTSSDWTIIATSQVTDSGEILGYSYRDGDLHYALLTPVPEPAVPLAAVSATAATLALRRRRRVP